MKQPSLISKDRDIALNGVIHTATKRGSRSENIQFLKLMKKIVRQNEKIIQLIAMQLASNDAIDESDDDENYEDASIEPKVGNKAKSDRKGIPLQSSEKQLTSEREEPRAKSSPLKLPIRQAFKNGAKPSTEALKQMSGINKSESEKTSVKMGKV